MKLTMKYDEQTGLMELITSSGSISLNKTEVGALYVLLKNVLGFRGRLLVWRKRRIFKQI